MFSVKDRRTYVGSTNDLERRFNEHTSGRVASTKSRRPLKLVHQEVCEDEEKARKLEKYYKIAAGRKKLRDILKLNL